MGAAGVNRPKIPVRDGLLPPKRIHPTVLLETGQVEYVQGWRWGFLCGGAAGAVVTALGVILGILVRR